MGYAVPRRLKNEKKQASLTRKSLIAEPKSICSHRSNITHNESENVKIVTTHTTMKNKQGMLTLR